MPGELRGCIEKEFEGEWFFVSRTDAFVLTQGDFKYIVLGRRYFDALPHEGGFPDDISTRTKEMMGRPLSDETVEEAYERRIQELGSKRVVTLADLEKVDWDEEVLDRVVERIKQKIGTKNYSTGEARRIFKLVDSNGKDMSESDKFDYDYTYRWETQLDFLDPESILSMIEGDSIEHRRKKLHLERRTRRELMPERWFTLLQGLEELSTDKQSKDVRIIFYWAH